MSKYPGVANTVCPFYLREAEKTISCEGINGCECLKMCFDSNDEKKEWQVEVCYTHDFLICPLATVINEEYAW